MPQTVPALLEGEDRRGMKQVLGVDMYRAAISTRFECRRHGKILAPSPSHFFSEQIFSEGHNSGCAYGSRVWSENISNQFSGYAKTDAGIAAGLGTLGTLSPVGSLVAK